MKKPENQPISDARAKLLALAAERYPDRHFKGQIDKDGNDGTDDLAEALYDLLQKTESENETFRSKNQALVDLFKKDPTSAEFINRLANNGDAAGAIIEMFGDRFLGMSLEEAKEKYQASLNEYNTRIKNDQDAIEAYKKNFNKSLEALEEWGNQKGLSFDKKLEIAEKLYSLVARISDDGVMDSSDFDMVFKSMNYDNDVAEARRQGEIAGRNAKVREQVISRNNENRQPPVNRGGQKGVVENPAIPRSAWSGIK